MQVKLISLTQSCIFNEDKSQYLSPEELIVYIARVSNPSNQLNTETSDKLLNYLIKNKHWSPFEMIDMCVEIVTSRAIAAQILRHRSFSFQEFSQRYANVTEFEPVELRHQAVTNRQSSSETFDPLINNNGYNKQASEKISQHIKDSQTLYKELLLVNVAKECARMVLPLTTQTKIYMKGSIRSWIHYLQVRTDPHTQLEHRLVAEQIQSLMTVNFPNITKALHHV